MGVGNREDPAVGNGNFMRVASEVFDGVAKTVEGLFDERTPVFFIECVFPGFPNLFVLQLPARRGKGKCAFRIQHGKVCEKFSFELVPQHVNRDEELGRRHFELAVPGQAAAGNNAVHVDMVTKLLIPGVKDLYNGRRSIEPFGIRRKLEQGLGAAAMQKIVQKLLICVKERIQLMRDRKDHMKIWRIDDFGTAFVHPDFLVQCLTTRAIAVAAGTIVDLSMAAVCAVTCLKAKVTGFAIDDIHCSLSLHRGQKRSLFGIVRIAFLKNLLYFVISHDRYLRQAGQRD